VLNPKSAEAFNLAGVLAEVLQDYKGAKKNYGQAIRLDRRYEPAQQNMRRQFEVITLVQATNRSILATNRGPP